MNIYIDGKRVDKNGKFIENSQSLLSQAYHTNKLISFNETSLARLTQRNSQTLSNEDSLNSQEGSQTLNNDENSINSQKSLKFKEAQERMRYEFFNPLSNNELFDHLLADDENYAYVLEKNGPCSIAGELKLRIPEGRYEAQWHSYGLRKNTLHLYNNFVSFNRHILIHKGNTPKDSQGCLLINDDFMDRIDDIIFQKKSISKEESFAKSLKNDFAKKILGKSINKLNDFVKEYVEVRIRNKFKRHKNSLALKFDGEFLSILIDNRITHSFQSVSGREQKINNKYYFTYEKERQALKNEGPIPEGEYFITPLSENVNDGVQYWDKAGIWQKLFAWLSFVDIKMGSWAKATPAWGKIRIPIQPKTKLVINSKGEEVLRSNFFIHGGIQAGSAGCIDLWKSNEEFFKLFLEYVEKYKDEILQNQGKIALIVKYRSGITVKCDDDYYTKQCMEFNNDE